MLPWWFVIARPRELGELTLVVLTALLLAVVLTYPLAFRIDSIGRVNTDDGRWSIWVVSWVAHALVTNPFGVFDANIFYPHKSTLAFSEANIAAGAIGVPAWVLTHNPYLTHNVVVLIGFVVAYAGVYYLIRHLTGSRPAAVVAGVLYAFCPYIFARTAHIQLLLTGGLPFCLLVFHRLVDQTTVSRAVTLGVLICVQSLACAYYGVFAILMVGLGTLFFAVTRGLWRSTDYWIAIALAAFVSIAFTFPFFLPYLHVQNEMGFARTLEDARQYSVNAAAWLASSAWAHRWWLPAISHDPPRPGDFNEVLFPGILTTVLGIAGAAWLLRRTEHGYRDVFAFYALIAVMAFWLSFGPDAGLYSAFYNTIPIFTFMRAPGRMGIMVVLALVVLGSPLLASLLARQRRPLLAGVAVAAIAAAELAAVPLRQLRDAEPISPVYRLLATLPYGPVIELPYWSERSDFPRHAYYMLNSTAHWMPLINGYSDHIPQDFRNTVVPLSSFPTRASFAILGRADTRYVVFHLNMYNAPLRRRLMERLDMYAKYLRPLVREGDVWLYEIVDWPN
jgi:hypothetical protein